MTALDRLKSSLQACKSTIHQFMNGDVLQSGTPHGKGEGVQRKICSD